MAQLARTGWYREVHIKSEGSDNIWVLIGARERLVRIRKDKESVGGCLQCFWHVPAFSVLSGDIRYQGQSGRAGQWRVRTAPDPDRFFDRGLSVKGYFVCTAGFMVLSDYGFRIILPKAPGSNTAI